MAQMLFQGFEASVREVAGGWDRDVGGFGTQCRHRIGVSADGRAREEEGEGPTEPGAGVCRPRGAGPGPQPRPRYPALRPSPASSTAAAPKRWDPSLKTNPPWQPWSPTPSPSGPYCVWSLASQASRILWTRQHFWNSWQTGGMSQGQQGCTLPSTHPSGLSRQQAHTSAPSSLWAVTASQPSPVVPIRHPGRRCSGSSTWRRGSSQDILIPQSPGRSCTPPWATLLPSLSRRKASGPRAHLLPGPHHRQLPAPGVFVPGPKSHAHPRVASLSE